MEIDYSTHKEDLNKVLEVMNEEQLESLFNLMQSMFVEAMFGISPPEKNSNDEDPPADDDCKFEDENAQPVVTKIDDRVDNEMINQIRAVNAVKKEMKQKFIQGYESFKNEMFKRPERKKS